MSAFADNCPEAYGNYGNENRYQNMFCRFMISADKTGSKNYRNIIFTDEGQIQVFSNFPGTTNSNSTGARVYYLFPFKEKKDIVQVNESHLSLKHPSGVVFDFDKNGKMSSLDLPIKVSKEINSKNKSGIEIQNFPKGLLVDLGYRMGASPVNNKNAIVTITDKRNIKCIFLNNEFNKIIDGEAELIYKTNLELHKFLTKKCPKLDISDLLKSAALDIETAMTIKKLGNAPKSNLYNNQNNSKRNSKNIEESDKIDEHLHHFGKKAVQK